MNDHYLKGARLLAACITGKISDFAGLLGTCVDNRLIARTLVNGAALWSLPWCPWSQTAAADDTLVVTYSEWKRGALVVARDLHTGRALWQTLVDE